MMGARVTKLLKLGLIRRRSHWTHREDRKISQDGGSVASTVSRPFCTASDTTPPSGNYVPLTENTRSVRFIAR
jgi:hypothetical protein